METTEVFSLSRKAEKIKIRLPSPSQIRETIRNPPHYPFAGWMYLTFGEIPMLRTQYCAY